MKAAPALGMAACPYSERYDLPVPWALDSAPAPWRCCMSWSDIQWRMMWRMVGLSSTDFRRWVAAPTCTRGIGSGGLGAPKPTTPAGAAVFCPWCGKSVTIVEMVSCAYCGKPLVRNTEAQDVAPISVSSSSSDDGVLVVAKSVSAIATRERVGVDGPFGSASSRSVWKCCLGVPVVQPDGYRGKSDSPGELG